MIEPFELNKQNCPHTFGELLKILRTRSNPRMTLEILAGHISSSRPVINRWENGEVIPPRAEVSAIIDRIVEALGCSDRERLMLRRAWLCDFLKGANLYKV